MPFFRPLHLGVAAAAGVAVGGTAVYIWSKQQRTLEQTATSDSRHHHPALKHGAPITSNVRFFTSYVAEYDPRLRNPRYVIEHFTPEVLRGNGDRSNSFFKEDSALEPRFRSTLCDFKNSGYDRGHMAPAANHKRSQEAMDDTFILTNISPQIGQGFNRDYWARFERFVQELANKCNDVYVVTGPCYLPRPNQSGNGWSMQYPMLGAPPRMVAVPTHFYKVVLGEGNDGNSTVLGAFVMPNAAIDPRTPLTAFSVPVSALEEVVGISFFPKYLRKDKREAIDRVSLEWQQLGHAEISRLKLIESAGNHHLLPPPVGATVSSSRVGAKELKPRSPGKGMQHICEMNGCRLPAERWWESDKKARDLRRTKSSPALGGRSKQQPQP